MMKQFQVVFGLCLALALAESVFGGAASCTPATCGDHPVEAYYQYSNCTGEVTYYPIYRNWDVCDSDDHEKAVKDEHGWADLYYYGEGASTCDISRENTTYWYDLYKYGACVSTAYFRDAGSMARGRRGATIERSIMSGAYMYLANVNATYGTHTPFDNQPHPAYTGYDSSCGAVDDCTLADASPSQMWYTYYSGLECQNPYVSYSNPTLAANTCYNYYNYSYYLQGCVDEQTTYYAYFLDAACSQPYQVGVWYTYCSGDTDVQNYCHATPTKLPSFVPSPTPTAAASMNQVSFLMALFASILALSMF